MSGKPHKYCRVCGREKPFGERSCLPCRRKYNAEYTKRRRGDPAFRDMRRRIARKYEATHKAEIAQRRQSKPPKKRVSLQSKRLEHERRLRQDFGIDFHDWALMYERQHGRCAGCLDLLRFDRTAQVDHCHKTGRVRGLLCEGCNQVLGRGRDNPETLRRLARFLEYSDQEQMCADLAA